MENSENTSFRYRYPGGKPFSEQERELFFGRHKDLKSLTNLIFLKQTVVLFGKSGYGKSSLINAGVIPELKKHEGVIYFSIRFNNYWKIEESQSPTPAESVNGRFSEGFTFEENDFSKLILNENSFWYWIKLHQWSKPNFKFIIFFDQFEELFRYPEDQIQVFGDQLVRLLFNAIPINYRKKIDDLAQDGYVNNKLIKFLNTTPDIKVIFSMRTDSVAQINRLANKLPSILQNCYELDALSALDAAEAIKKPANIIDPFFKSPSFEFEDEAINKIIKSISHDNKIEGTALQILLRHIEENIVIKNDERIITAKRLGEINDIFLEYYETVLDKFADEDKEIVYNILENQLIAEGDRNALNLRSIEQNLKKDPIINKRLKADAKLIKRLLDILEQSSLIIKEDDVRRKEIFEIGHDKIAQAVIRVAALRREQQQERNRQEELRKEIELRLEEKRKEDEAQLKEKKREDEARKKEYERQLEQNRLQMEYDRKEAIILKHRQMVLGVCITAVSVFFLVALILYFRSDKLATSAELLNAKYEIALDSLKLQKKNVIEERAKTEKALGDEFKNVVYQTSKLDRRMEAVNSALESYNAAKSLMRDNQHDSLYVAIVKSIKEMEGEADKINFKIKNHSSTF